MEKTLSEQFARAMEILDQERRVLMSLAEELEECGNVASQRFEEIFQEFSLVQQTVDDKH